MDNFIPEIKTRVLCHRDLISRRYLQVALNINTIEPII